MSFGLSDDDQDSPVKQIVSQIGIAITVQPANVVGVIGGNASFSVTVANSFGGLVQYQWQIQTDGATWGDLVETAGYYENVTSATLAVKALDNFLATRTSLNFRVRLGYPGTAFILSNSAALSIPIHTDWGPAGGLPDASRVLTTGVRGTAFAGPDLVINAPIVTGFAGPYTYLWSRLTGVALIDFPTNSTSSFYEPVWPNGVSVSTFICTITNGIDSVQTDPVYCVIIGQAPGLFYVRDNATPQVSTDGALEHYAPTAFVGPWQVVAQQNNRCPGVAAVTIDSPASFETTFTLNSTLRPGCAISLIAWAPGIDPGNPGNGFAVRANTSWQ